jgi:hypothetical protein
MLAADRDFIDFDALRNGAPALAIHTAGTTRKFVARRPPMLSYWEVLLPFAPSQALIVVRFGVEGEDPPTAAQLAFVHEVESRYIAYLAAALVRLKPALAKYVSPGSADRPLNAEFVVTGMYVAPLHSAPDLTSPAWDLLLRCRTDPSYEFVARFRGRSVVQLLVDRSLPSP